MLAQHTFLPSGISWAYQLSQRKGKKKKKRENLLSQKCLFLLNHTLKSRNIHVIETCLSYTKLQIGSEERCGWQWAPARRRAAPSTEPACSPAVLTASFLLPKEQPAGVGPAELRGGKLHFPESPFRQLLPAASTALHPEADVSNSNQLSKGTENENCCLNSAEIVEILKAH